MTNMTIYRRMVWQDLFFATLDEIAQWKAEYAQYASDLGEKYSEEQLDTLLSESNYDQLGDERMNLNLVLPTEVIAIASLGFWYGKRQGYKVIGCKLSDCLYLSGDGYCRWYVDASGNLRGEQVHHDGTHRILYRMFKPSVTETVRERFLARVVDGEDVSEDISRYTVRLGDIIGDVYGWKFPGRRSRFAFAERRVFDV